MSTTAVPCYPFALYRKRNYLGRDFGRRPDLYAIQGLEESSAPLKRGKLDLVFAVGSADSPLLNRLAKDDGIVLQGLPRAAAYARRDGFVSALELPAGSAGSSQRYPCNGPESRRRDGEPRRDAGSPSGTRGPAARGGRQGPR